MTPHDTHHPSADAPGADLRQNLAGLAAMVVDDDRAFGENLAAALEDQGLDATPHQSPRAALEAARQGPFDLAFVDINMPDMSGIELARRLMEVRPGMRLVLISDRGTFDQLVQALKIGAYDFLSKPLRQGDLHMCLSRFCQRRELQGRMEAAERRHTALIQNIPLLVFRLRRDCSLEFINRACRSMLGFSAAQALNAPDWFLSRTHEDDRPAIQRTLDQAFLDPRAMTVECRLAHAKGHFIHGILKTIPSPDQAAPSGRLLDCIFMDISERVFVENALVQDEKMKTLGAITAEVSHEIRNPLMAIAGFARRLSSRMPDSTETEIILRESQRLERLLTRIQTYLDPAEPDLAATDVNALMRTILQRDQGLPGDKGIQVRAQLEPELPQAQADPAMLGKVFSIILSDATKALEAGGVLSVRTFLGGGMVNAVFRYRFADLRSIDAERLYLPFEEGGFGLPLCYRLVKKMCGLMSLAREHDEAVISIALAR